LANSELTKEEVAAVAVAVAVAVARAVQRQIEAQNQKSLPKQSTPAYLLTSLLYYL
jgi:hypothetical protein